MKVFLIDITRHKGSVPSILSMVRIYAKQSGADQITWFHFPWQGIVPLPEEKEVTVGGSAAEALTQLIRELSADSFRGAQFNVFSYDAFARSKPASLKAEGIDVEASSLATVITTVKTVNLDPLRSLAERSGPGVICLNEAIELTKALLQEGRHTSPENSMRQVSLRLALEKRNPRAAKDRAQPESLNLITRIVSDGLRNGWLERSLKDGVAGTEMIWLKGKSPEQSPLSVGTSEEPQITDLGQKRTKDFTERLHKLGLHVQKDVRDLLFKAAQKHTNKKLTVAQLFRAAVQDVSGVAEAKHVTCRNWLAAAASAQKLALRAGVLLDDKGSPLADSFSARGAKVATLATDAVDRVDDYLLLLVIEQIDDISTRDAVSLAHALYRQSPEVVSRDEMVDKVYEVVGRLDDKIMEGEDGFLRNIGIPKIGQSQVAVTAVVN